LKILDILISLPLSALLGYSIRFRDDAISASPLAICIFLANFNLIKCQLVIFKNDYLMDGSSMAAFM